MIKSARTLIYCAKSTTESPFAALFALVSLVLFFSGNQEIVAHNDPYDGYYFLLRSASFDLMGNHLAPIKEYLYSLFIYVSRIYGLSLRNFEVICYGIALAWLWVQVKKLTHSVLVAWFAVLPLAIFTYQSSVFNLTTYDALQLILTPLTVGSSIMVFYDKASLKSLLVAGLMAALQVLTRPEGMLFLLPPFASLVLVAATNWEEKGWRVRVGRCLKGAIIITMLPLVFQQAMCAVNQAQFGFWAPTIMKSKDFTRALDALMSIRPTNDDGGVYAPVPISSMEQAYQISPAFRRAEGYFSPNLNGKGWSAWAPKGYETHDGSIDGGHFQWALLEASANVAGQGAQEMLGYLRSVTDELNVGFKDGRVQKRQVFSTALGPNFSPLEGRYWHSFASIGRILLNYGAPVLPQIGYVTPEPEVERKYDLLALRRTALLRSDDRWIAGWMVSPSEGLPSKISLSEDALKAGVALKLIERPDVSGLIQGLSSAQAAHPLIGFELSVPGLQSGAVGAVEVRYGGVVTEIPLAKLLDTAEGVGFSQGGVRVQVDRVLKSFDFSRSPQFSATRWLSLVAYYIIRVAFLTAIILFAAILLIGWRSRAERRVLVNLLLVGAVASSIFVPRVALLAGIDAFMYPGVLPRYLATAGFSIWFFSTSVIILVVHHASLRAIGYVVNRRPLVSYPP